MKKVKNLFYLLVVSIIVLNINSCTKDEKNDNVVDTILFNDTNYNNDLNNLSIVLSEALNDHEDFRRIVKVEALKQFDGDYDILLKNFKNNAVTDSKSKSTITVKELLGVYFQNSLNEKNPQDIIDDLTALYPNLQISVPVHAEEWDENYIPKVAFAPEEFQEETDDYIPGYYNGQGELIDAVNPPTLPVVVVGMNERIAQQPIIIDPEGPIVTISLTGLTIEQGIRITWSIGTNTGDPIFAYQIFRKGVGDSDFVHITTVVGVNNMTYNDIYVDASESYSYYVQARDYDGNTSNPSNIVNITAQTNPNSVLSFDAVHLGTDDTELRWNNDYSTAFAGTKVYKRTITVDSQYYLYGTFDTNTHLSIDNNLIEGKRINYRVEQYTSTGGVSNPKFDFVHVPYRDYSQPSKIYIEKIKFTDDLENWFQGAPEFHLTIAGINRNNGTPFVYQQDINFDFCHNHSYCSFNDRLVLNWHPDKWYDILSFRLVEYDGNKEDETISLYAKYIEKKTDKTGFNGELGVNYSYKIDKRDEDCGNGYLDYYEPSSGWIYFADHGARIYYSIIDTNENCDTTNGF